MPIVREAAAIDWIVVNRDWDDARFVAHSETVDAIRDGSAAGIDNWRRNTERAARSIDRAANFRPHVNSYYLGGAGSHRFDCKVQTGDGGIGLDRRAMRARGQANGYRCY
jgi:hypothetical protein